jgi:hypothetical protein
MNSTTPEQSVFLEKARFERSIGRGYDLFYRVWNESELIGVSETILIKIVD